MVNFILEVLNGNLAEILGDLYAPCVACVAVSWAIIAFAGSVEIFIHVFPAMLRGSK